VVSAYAVVHQPVLACGVSRGDHVHPAWLMMHDVVALRLQLLTFNCVSLLCLVILLMPANVEAQAARQVVAFLSCEVVCCNVPSATDSTS
jgi:hypothetical protein